MKKVLMNFCVNGENYEVAAAPNRLLLDVLREELNLTGTKLGCDDGSCGACTVLIEGVPSQCCMMLAVSYQNREITTVEGLAENGQLDPLQKAFCTEGGQQCGFCTPGILMSARALLLENPNPSIPEIQTALAGNVCRCTGYTKIIAAILRAATDYQEAAEKEERVAISRCTAGVSPASLVSSVTKPATHRRYKAKTWTSLLSVNLYPW